MTLYSKQSFSTKWLNYGFIALFIMICCCFSVNMTAQQACSGFIVVSVENGGEGLCENSAAVPVSGRLFPNTVVGTFDYTWTLSHPTAGSFDVASGQATLTPTNRDIMVNFTPLQAQGGVQLFLTITSTTDGCSLNGFGGTDIFPEVTANIGNNAITNICQGGSLNLNGIPGGGNGNYTHLWEVVSSSPQPATAALILNNPASEDPTLTPPPGTPDGQTYNLRYTVATDDENCNIATKDISVTVRENANSASLASTNNLLEICPGEAAVMTLNIASSSSNPYTYSAVIHNSVTDENTTISNLANGDNITFNPNETTTYTLISAMNQFSCPVDMVSGAIEFIVDETNPTIAGPSSQDLNADANCAAVVPNLLDDVTATDNCDQNLTVSQSPAAGTPFTGGTNHNAEQDVTITAEDASGNIGTRVITLVLKDVTAPVFTACPTAGYSQGTDDGSCTANVSFPQPAFIENCNDDISVDTDDEDVAISTTDGVTSAVFPLGNTQVTYTLTDGVNGNTTCSFTVTVLDDEIPTIVCPPSVALDNDNNNCTAGFVYDRPTGSDNCGENIAVTESNDNNLTIGTNNNGESSATFPKGITTITYTVSDGVNTGIPCSFTVTVNDTQLPTIDDCPENQTVDAGTDCTTLVNWDLPTADDNCPADLTFVATSDNGTIINNDGTGTFPLGVTNVTYTANDGSTTPQTCDFVITVEDDTDPIIDCANSENVLVDAGEGCTATVPNLAGNLSNQEDNCPGTIVITQTPAAGTDITGTHGATQEVIVTATDAAGNFSECNYTIQFNDIIAPTVTEHCPETSYIVQNYNNSCTSIYDFLIPEFADNCDSNLEITPTATNNVIISEAPTGNRYIGSFPVGTTTVTVTGTDEAGLEATCIFDVTVSDLQAPDITCPPNQDLNADLGACGTNFNAPPATATDNCTDNLVVTHDFEGGASNMNATGFYPVGVTMVTWTATDSNGNMTSCVQTVEVTDNENPTVTCPLIIETVDVTADSGCSSTIPNFIGDANGNGADENTITFGDNCAFTLVQSPIGGTAFGTAHNDSETVTVTITDASNNTATCDITVRMRDEIAPTIACPSTVTVNNDPGSCEGTMPNFIGNANGEGADPSLSFADNCAFELSQSFAAGNTFGDDDNEGHNHSETVTVTITDDANNEATCAIVVTLIDNEAPVFNEGPIATTINANTSSSSAYDCSALVPDRTSPSFYFTPERTVNNNTTPRADHVSDNCTDFDGFVFTQDIPAGTVITEDTDLTVTVTDAAGNTDQIVIQLIFNDNEAPMIDAGTCPDDLTINANLNSCFATVILTDPSFTDNCDMNLGALNTNVGFFTSELYDENGSTSRECNFNLGTTGPIFYESTDADGNTRRCEFNVTVVNPDWVVDFTPEGTVNSNPVNFQFTGMGAGTWKWSFGDGTFSTQQNPNKTYANTGDYTVCLEINNCVNTQVCKTIDVTQRPPNNSVTTGGNTNLANFYAAKQGKEVALNWETTSEYDLESFTLEASRNGVDFEDLTDMAGEGDLDSVHEYAHTDEYAVEGYNFYRLRQNNMDGTFSYSDIVSAQLKTDRPNLQVTAYPNPVTDVLYLQLPENSETQSVQIELYNLQGQLVLQDYINYSNEDIALNLHDLTTGNHILVVKTAEDVFTKQIVVQK